MAKILVAYASKHQSTAEIAEVIAGVMRAQGLDVECVEAAEASAGPYDAVVLGSGVYIGRWLKHARAFLKANRDELAAKPLWIFSSGPVAEQAEALAGDRTAGEPPTLAADAEKLGARDHVVFGGRIPDDPKGFVEKAIVRHAAEQEQDARDWDAIRAWATGIADELTSAVN